MSEVAQSNNAQDIIDTSNSNNTDNSTTLQATQSTESSTNEDSSTSKTVTFEDTATPTAASTTTITPPLITLTTTTPTLTPTTPTPTPTITTANNASPPQSDNNSNNAEISASNNNTADISTNNNSESNITVTAISCKPLSRVVSMTKSKSAPALRVSGDDHNNNKSPQRKGSNSIYDGVPLPTNMVMTARDWAAREIYTSEISYNRKMDTIVLTYLPRLKEVCSAEEIKILFSNIVVIRNFSIKLLSDLEERMMHWTRQQMIGDIFLKVHPFFRAYTQYCNNYDTAIECLTRCMKTNQQFADICKDELAQTPDGLGPDLQSLLITPVQRIPRYGMLLKEVVQRTPQDHPDYLSLNSALEKIREITESVNVSIKGADRGKVYEQVVNSVAGIKEHMAPHRRFLLEDNFVISMDTHDNQEKFWLILFNEMLFIATGEEKNDRKLAHFFHLQHTWIIDIKEPAQDGSVLFSFLTPEEKCTVHCSNAKQKTLWMGTLQHYINVACKEDKGDAEKRFFKYSFATGDKYEGEWKMGKMHGKGKYTFADSREVDGIFAEGVMERQLEPTILPASPVRSSLNKNADDIGPYTIKQPQTPTRLRFVKKRPSLTRYFTRSLVLRVLSYLVVVLFAWWCFQHQQKIVNTIECAYQQFEQ